MKQIELRQLTLTNYRNIEYGNYQFEGNSKIVGENRIGKTNTLEAIMWLLTDKLLNGGTDIQSIKPLNDTKKEVIVKGTFLVDNATTITLKKAYQEQWVKTRGSTEMVLKGHTTTYYFNEVKQGTKKEYECNVNEAFDIKTDDRTKIEFLRLLVDPFYLGELGESKDWTQLRQLIIGLVGDIKDQDVFNAHPELKRVCSVLDKVNGNVEQAKKFVSQTINGLKDTLVAENANIELLSQTKKPTDEEIALAKKGIEEHETIIASLRNTKNEDKVSALIEKEINDLKSQSLELKQKELNEFAKDHNSNDRKELNNELDLLSSKIRNAKNEKANCEYSIATYENNIKELETERLSLMAKFDEIKAKKQNVEIETECPYCHRAYEESQIEELKAIALEKVETEKQEIIKQGQKCNEHKNQNKSNIENAKVLLSKIESTIKDLENEFDKVARKIDELGQEVEYAPSLALMELENKVKDLGYKLENSRLEFAKGTQDLNAKIIEHQEAMQPFKQVLADLDYYNRQQETIKATQDKRNQHNVELMNAEQDKESLSMFIRYKLEMLDNNVAKVFGNIKFQLISENINGGYDIVCKPYIYDSLKDESSKSLWKSGSKSERVITGIAIADIIKQKLDLPNLPILFDEGGEISTDTFKTRFKTNAQLICVKVQDNIPTPMVLSID